jgi:hypothetical protein
MIEDLDVARLTFGYVMSELGLFQIVGALSLGLTVLASVKRWRYG